MTVQKDVTDHSGQIVTMIVRAISQVVTSRSLKVREALVHHAVTACHLMTENHPVLLAVMIAVHLEAHIQVDVKASNKKALVISKVILRTFLYK